MERRKFIGTSGAGMAGILAAGSAPAFAQSGPAIKWRLASSFPKSLDTIYGAAEVMSKRVASSTGGKFQIQVFAAGEIVPAFGVVDAVQNGTVQAAHTAPYYFWGKDAAFALDTAIPFSLNARQTMAWQGFGGGNELFDEQRHAVGALHDSRDHVGRETRSGGEVGGEHPCLLLVEAIEHELDARRQVDRRLGAPGEHDQHRLVREAILQERDQLER